MKTAIIGMLLFLLMAKQNGGEWIHIGPSPAAVIAVAVESHHLYSGTQNEGIFKSTDYGDTWKATGSGLSGAITYLITIRLRQPVSQQEGT